MTVIDDAHIGQAVRALRNALGLSQTDVVDVMVALGHKWHLTIMGRVENGQRSLRAAELPALAAALSTTPTDLLGVDLAEAAKRVRIRIVRERVWAAQDELMRLEQELNAVSLRHGGRS